MLLLFNLAPHAQVWSGDGLTLWRPVPPPGYVSLGCVATSASPDMPAPLPPPLRAVGCVHERCVVETRLGECLLLCANGNLWEVQNAACTFDVSPAEGHLPEVGAPL
jgi:vacuolar protein sorting-associated protein 13A/C